MRRRHLMSVGIGVILLTMVLGACKRREELSQVASGGGAIANSLAGLKSCEELKPRQFRDSERNIKDLDALESARLSSFLTYETFNVREGGAKTVNEKALFTWGAAKLNISVRDLYLKLHEAIRNNGNLRSQLGGNLLTNTNAADPMINTNVERKLAQLLADGTMGIAFEQGRVKILTAANAQATGNYIMFTKDVMRKNAIDHYSRAFALNPNFVQDEAKSTQRRVRNIGYTKSSNRVGDLERLLEITDVQLRALGIDVNSTSPVPRGFKAEQKAGAKEILFARLDVFPALYNNAKKSGPTGELPGLGASTQSEYAKTSWLGSSMNEVLTLIRQFQPTTAELESSTRRLAQASVRLELAGYSEASTGVQKAAQGISNWNNVQNVRLQEMVKEAQHATARGYTVYAREVAELMSSKIDGTSSKGERLIIDAFEIVSEVGSVEAMKKMLSRYGNVLGAEVKSAAEAVIRHTSNAEYGTFLSARGFEGDLVEPRVRRRQNYLDMVIGEVETAIKGNRTQVEVDGRLVMTERIDLNKLRAEREALALLHKQLVSKQDKRSGAYRKTQESLKRITALRSMIARARANLKKK